MAMKRKFAEIESLDMAKCLMLLSQSLQTKPIKTSTEQDVFECKTCNRKFSSFQALGGHRASHKKPRLPIIAEDDNSNKAGSETTKRKMHACSICGVEFALGQALGGHMRRHRAVAMGYDHSRRGVSELPVLRRSNSSKRVFGLDLNLTPLENDLESLFGKMAPKVDPLI
ncbi:hypothetical protein JCGZ_09023 [Jatropha curcas]|uniref:C2H2-type domain-containing protein n=1 Tax=Jatropha curcas TaxID=180498 RepID=A0A067KTI1_JATCU|nr:zinc finger protein ZAT11 [Jatropha curcas]KDP35585.1 hypothetical protein JCGZ_09023 [Jatropha curcas]